MPEKNKKKSDHSHTPADHAGAGSSAPAAEHAGKKRAAGNKHVHFPLRSHRDGICEVKILPDDCVEIYRKASFVLYKNDQLKCYFIAAEDYRTESHKLSPSLFDHSHSRHAHGATRHDPLAGKYYAGVCWSIELDGHGRKIVFCMTTTTPTS